MMNPKNIYRGPFFFLDAVSPDIFEVKWDKEYKMGKYVAGKEHSYYRYENRYFSEHHVGYLGISILEYAGEGSYDSAGGCICKVVDISWPKLDFKKQLFWDIVKNVSYTPGQIVVELPSGRKIPVFSTIPIVEELNHVFRIGQNYSDEFIEALKEYKDNEYYNYHDKISLKLYKKSDRGDLMKDLKSFAKHREQQKCRRTLQSQTNNTTQKTVMSDAEMLALWKTIG